MTTTSPPTVHCQTETAGRFRQILQIDSAQQSGAPFLDAHTLHADVSPALGGEASAPGPHDYFDAALASCKALTAAWYARKQGIPLERVEAHVERDDTGERHGVYVLRVRLAFHGPLDEAQRQRLHDAVARCPIHKLMTTTEVQIETAPLSAG